MITSVILYDNYEMAYSKKHRQKKQQHHNLFKRHINNHEPNGYMVSVHLVPIFDISHNIKNVWPWFWYWFLFFCLLLCMPINSVEDKIRMMCILNENHLVEPIMITINYGSLETRANKKLV